MHVDRSRFLLLTSAMAAACGRPPPSTTPLGGSDSDFDTTVASAPPGPERSGQDAGATPTPAPASGVVQIAPPPPASAATPDVPAPRAGCDDLVGHAVSCQGLRAPGPTCEQGMNVSPQACTAMSKVAKPRVAEALTRCLVERSKSGGPCGPGDWLGDCGERALGVVCSVDHSREAECRRVVQACGPSAESGASVSVDSCLRLLSAVLPGEQNAAITCISEGCSAPGCFLQLSWRHTD